MMAATDTQPIATSAIPVGTTSELHSPMSPQNISHPLSADAVNWRAALADVNFQLVSSVDDDRVLTPLSSGASTPRVIVADASQSLLRRGWNLPSLDQFPNEVLMRILGYLDVSDVLTTSRVNHHFRDLSLAPILHSYRLQHVRVLLPPLLTSPTRPTHAELVARHILVTQTTQISRRLAWKLVAIRLARRLPQRPSPETLVQRGVLPPECVPGCGCAPIAPALVAKRRAIEKEKLKDGLRRWVDGVWRDEVKERSEDIKKWEERDGIGRVWRLRRHWESMATSTLLGTYGTA